MESLGHVNSREILYISTRQEPDWAKALPKSNWLVALIGDDGGIDDISCIVKECLDKNVLCVCALGRESRQIQATFDREIVKREIAKGYGLGDPLVFEETPMTTEDQDIGKGFWFATSAAFCTHQNVDKIVCLDLRPHGGKAEFADLAMKINSG